MKKLCIVFPGRKYSVDRSLLYYPSKFIESHDYEMIYLHYDLPKESEEEPLENSLNRGRKYIEEHIKGKIDFSIYDKIIFISKSIGTVLAGELKEYLSNSDKIYQIFLTPIDGALKYIINRDLIICGENDSYLENAKDKLAMYSNSYIIPKLAHSLESKRNYHLSIKTVENITGIIETYVDSYGL